MRAWLGNVYAMTGEHERAVAAIRRLQGEKGGDGPADPGLLMIVWAGLGEREKVLESLERGTAGHSVEMLFLKAGADLFYPEIRDDPRYRNLLREVGVD